MTNQEFLESLEAFFQSPIYQHAKKLVAVVEAAKDTYGATFDEDDGEGDGFYVCWEDYMALGKVLKELEVHE